MPRGPGWEPRPSGLRSWARRLIVELGVRDHPVDEAEVLGLFRRDDIAEEGELLGLVEPDEAGKDPRAAEVH